LFGNSANYLEELANKRYNSTFPLKKWLEHDNERVNKSAEITLKSLKSKIFSSEKNVKQDLCNLRENLKQTIDDATRENNDNNGKKKLDDIILELQDIENNDIKELAKKLRNISKIISSNLEPTSKYLIHVIEHELADDSIHPNKRICDAAELIFAADGLKLLGKWDDNFYIAAIEKVIPLITYKGRVPSHKPFDVATKGYVLNVSGAEVIDAFCSLLKKSEYPIDIENVRKFIKYFDDTWKDDSNGWRHERSEANEYSARWVSCISLNALRAMREMVDQRINKIIFNHLSVKYPKDITLGLNNLFYSDYGLSISGIQKGKTLAFHLQELRAHVLGVKELPENLKVEYSTILFGPPGTGKTTLVEALAKSAKVPLVEITPSDILMGGEEKVETRARVVFEALSMLTNCVILFDEFEPILWKREEGIKPSSIYQFLTPGILPKLKKLHEKAKYQNIAYVLSTNIISGLDEAAIRDGRFDVKIGVYPPDLYSRAGRLLSEILFSAESAQQINKENFKTVLKLTSSLGMTQLGKLFTYKSGKREKTPINYILNIGEMPIFPEPEMKFIDKQIKTPNIETVNKIEGENNHLSETNSNFVTDKNQFASNFSKIENDEWGWVTKKDKIDLPINDSLFESIEEESLKKQ
jgi:hypothetical protein